TWKGEPVTLTVTEFLILHALAQRPGVVKSRDALMDSAYDEQVYVDDRTIDSHIKRLRKKFKAVDESFDMIETLYGVGYRFREACPSHLPRAHARQNPAATGRQGTEFRYALHVAQGARLAQRAAGPLSVLEPDPA